MGTWLLTFWGYLRKLQKFNLFTIEEAHDLAAIRVQYELDPERYQ